MRSVVRDLRANISAEAGARQTYEALIGLSWIDQKGGKKLIGIEDVLVVTPYNMQVNHLRDILPADARV